jgi:hypothetical protein
MPDMISAEVAGVCIAVHTARDPSEAEWAEWMAVVATRPRDAIRVLAVTEGGGPNSVHRAQFVGAVDKPRIAVVSDALKVRGIVTALSWFVSAIRVFSADDYQGAARHLEIDAAQLAAIRVRVRAMASQLTPPSPAARI